MMWPSHERDQQRFVDRIKARLRRERMTPEEKRAASAAQWRRIAASETAREVERARKRRHYHAHKGDVGPIGRPSRSGVPGVHWNSRRQAWQAWVGGRSVGFYATVDEARQAQEGEGL